jgi:hypothetical protein
VLAHRNIVGMVIGDTGLENTVAVLEPSEDGDEIRIYRMSVSNLQMRSPR